MQFACSYFLSIIHRWTLHSSPRNGRGLSMSLTVAEARAYRQSSRINTRHFSFYLSKFLGQQLYCANHLQIICASKAFLLCCCVLLITVVRCYRLRRVNSSPMTSVVFPESLKAPAFLPGRITTRYVAFVTSLCLSLPWQKIRTGIIFTLARVVIE